jgi:hypothetical protein
VRDAQQLLALIAPSNSRRSVFGAFSRPCCTSWVVAELKVATDCSLTGRERECVSQPEVPGPSHDAYPLLLNVAPCDGHLEAPRLSA